MRREAHGREPRHRVRMSSLDLGTIAAAERAEQKREPSCADLEHLPVPFLLAGGESRHAELREAGLR